MYTWLLVNCWKVLIADHFVTIALIRVLLRVPLREIYFLLVKIIKSTSDLGRDQCSKLSRTGDFIQLGLSITLQNHHPLGRWTQLMPPIHLRCGRSNYSLHEIMCFSSTEPLLCAVAAELPQGTLRSTPIPSAYLDKHNSHSLFIYVFLCSSGQCPCILSLVFGTFLVSETTTFLLPCDYLLNLRA